MMTEKSEKLLLKDRLELRRRKMLVGNRLMIIAYSIVYIQHLLTWHFSLDHFTWVSPTMAMAAIFCGFVVLDRFIALSRNPDSSFGKKIYITQFLMWLLCWGYTLTYSEKTRYLDLFWAFQLLTFLMAGSSGRMALLMLLACSLEYLGVVYFFSKQGVPDLELFNVGIFLIVSFGIVHLTGIYEKQRKDLAENRRKLQEQAESLKAMDRQKTMFFQNISHELRTPLTLLLNPLEAVNRLQPDNEDIQTATRNARRLLRLVNQLLDLQKIQAGRKELKLIAVDLLRILLNCADFFRSSTSHRHIQFKLTVDGIAIRPDEAHRWKVFVSAEIDALEKIIFNFLSNALKYTPEGGTIELGLIQTDPNQTRVFTRDSGPGISAEDQKKLFQTFSQVENSTTRDYEGTGLGLALVKQLAELMQGTVGVESELGQGSTFHFSLPRIKEPAESATIHDISKLRSWMLAESSGATGLDTEVNVPVESAWTGETILVVDDLDDMRKLIAKSLQAFGYRILRAGNGDQGLRVAQSHKPDLIITDWMMPQLSGPDMIQLLRQDQDLCSTPVILLTAKSDEESKIIGSEIGADVFLGKPFNEQELGSAVRNLLSLKKQEKEVKKLNEYITSNVLKRYFPKEVIEEIRQGRYNMDQAPRTIPITILFTDIAGFTALSETLGADQVARFLNHHLSTMTHIIFEHGGTIDKFIGDSIMVLFGTPKEEAPPLQIRKAFDCARAMQQAMERLGQESVDARLQAVKMRIGIHHGLALVGNFGSPERSDYTAIGPTINLASRIESVCEPGEIFLSQEVAEILGTDVEKIGKFTLRGIQGEHTLYKAS